MLGYTVLRTGALWPAVLVHALVNFTTIAAWQGAGPSGFRVPAVIDLFPGPDPEPRGDRRLT